METLMYQAIEERFLSYINSMSFYQDQDNILNALKLTHTNRVVELSEILAASIFENDNNFSKYADLSKIIAILHDIARWNQMRMYGGFTDIESDHGEMGADIISQNDMINGLDDSQKQIALTAIREHNKKYAGTYDELTQTFVNIIRDADKIDNFYIEVENYGSNRESMKSVLPFSNEHKLSPHIYKCIMNDSLADSIDRETRIDFKFFKMAWCYDIKMPKSIELIRENSYIHDIYGDIQKPDEYMRTAYKKICTYLEKPYKLKCGS